MMLCDSRNTTDGFTTSCPHPQPPRALLPGNQISPSAQTTLSVCRGKPAHTTHSDGNFHLRSCPSGTAKTEYL
ncbi:hypothetical protein INR49_030829 [Caranx melampygus]|nr:hypothetical protein INR49_030829 [Caranx melampygus]